MDLNLTPQFRTKTATAVPSAPPSPRIYWQNYLKRSMDQSLSAVVSTEQLSLILEHHIRQLSPCAPSDEERYKTRVGLTALMFSNVSGVKGFSEMLLEGKISLTEIASLEMKELSALVTEGVTLDSMKRTGLLL